ncbi:MAG: hypothetical protein PVH02_14590, partial [Desulfobacteraceae bacterium]|jgi:hypothetical protein
MPGGRVISPDSKAEKETFVFSLIFNGIKIFLIICSATSLLVSIRTGRCNPVYALPNWLPLSDVFDTMFYRNLMGNHVQISTKNKTQSKDRTKDLVF